MTARLRMPYVHRALVPGRYRSTSTRFQHPPHLRAITIDPCASCDSASNLPNCSAQDVGRCWVQRAIKCDSARCDLSNDVSPSLLGPRPRTVLDSTAVDMCMSLRALSDGPGQRVKRACSSTRVPESR